MKQLERTEPALNLTQAILRRRDLSLGLSQLRNPRHYRRHLLRKVLQNVRRLISMLGSLEMHELQGLSQNDLHQN
jgi:hypothetical protein